MTVRIIVKHDDPGTDHPVNVRVLQKIENGDFVQTAIWTIGHGNEKDFYIWDGQKLVIEEIGQGGKPMVIPGEGTVV